jgi:hypothetical protein
LKAESCFIYDQNDQKKKRGIRLFQKTLKRLELYYDVPDEIKFGTLCTEISRLEDGQGSKNYDFMGSEDKSHAQYASDTDQKTDEKKARLSPNDQISVQSVPKVYSVRQEEQETDSIKENIYNTTGKPPVRPSMTHEDEDEGEGSQQEGE